MNEKLKTESTVAVTVTMKLMFGYNIIGKQSPVAFLVRHGSGRSLAPNGTIRSTHESLNVYFSKSLSLSLFTEVIPSKAEMTLEHLKRRWLNNTIILNYIKVPSVYPATWGFIYSQVKATKPLPISTYMRQCLS